MKEDKAKWLANDFLRAWIDCSGINNYEKFISAMTAKAPPGVVINKQTIERRCGSIKHQCEKKGWGSPAKPSKPAKLSSLSQSLVDDERAWKKLGLKKLTPDQLEKLKK